MKAKIAQEKGEYDAERMKVIYSGASPRDTKMESLLKELQLTCFLDRQDFAG